MVVPRDPAGRTRTKNFHHAEDDAVELAADLEVPDPNDRPPRRGESRIGFAVAGHVARDLLIPDFAGSPGLVTRWMPVPKRPIHEDRDSERWPGKVRRARSTLVVAAPTTHAPGVERASECDLRRRVLGLDGGHDPPALLGGSCICHAQNGRSGVGASGCRTRLRAMPPRTENGAGRPLGPRRPIAVDLFAGAGGLSLGLEQAGFDVVAAVEYDPVHAATHEFNFPKTKVLCADVSKPLQPSALVAAVGVGLDAHGHDLAKWDGELDLIAGGPPCQGFSFIGKRLVDDKRNQLVFHFFRLVSALRPRYFVMENVPGMAKGGHASILDELIAEFEEAGYRFPDGDKYRVINAANFGVPQERHRLFLIGTRADQEATASPPSPTVCARAKRSAAPAFAVEGSELPLGPTVGDAVRDLPNLNRFPRLRESDDVRLSHDVVAAMDAGASPYARRLRGVERDPQDFSYPRVWDAGLLTGSMRTDHTEKSTRRFKATKHGETEPISRFYKLDPEGLCNTLRAGSGSERGAFTSPRPIHPDLPRVLSNREAARLHSFPDWFRLHTTKWHGFRQIGNAVAPLVGRAVGAEVVKALGVAPPVPVDAIELGDVKLLGLTMSQATAHFGADAAFIPAKRTRGAVVARAVELKSDVEIQDDANDPVSVV